MKKLTTYINLTKEEITGLLAGTNNSLTISTQTYPELDQFEQGYWKFHSPWGNPGDELLVKEPYKITRLCQDATGYFATIEYQDGTSVVFPVATPLALTAKDTFISAENIPNSLIRCKLLIQDVQLAVDGNSWVFVVKTVKDTKPETPKNTF